MATDLPGGGAHVDRLPDLAAWSARKSLFLIGPRQTGKTTLIRRQLPHARVYDLVSSFPTLVVARADGSQVAQTVGLGARAVPGP